MNTVIIGAGPAGIAAAIQLKRSIVPFALVEKGPIGGLLLNANLVENYPGFPEGISGVGLADKFGEHLKALGISVTKGEVVSVERDGGSFVTTLNDAESLVSDNLIIASGTKGRSLDIPLDVNCEVYPLFGVSGKKIAVIGSGDAAFDYALSLSRMGNSVRILMRSDEPKCLPLLKERAVKAGVEILANTPLTERTAAGFDHVIAAIGREPLTGFLSEEIMDCFEGRGDIEGLYFAGDIRNGRNRYVATAVADGMRCAEQIASKI